MLSDALPVAGIAAGNVTLTTKINTLVANSARLGELSPGNQAVLRDAGAATLQWVLSHRTTESANAAAYCNRGGKIANATPANLQALVQTVQRLYGQLEEDPETKAMIGRIRALKTSVHVPATGIAAVC